MTSKREREMQKNNMAKTFFVRYELHRTAHCHCMKRAMSWECVEELPCSQENSPEKDLGSSSFGTTSVKVLEAITRTEMFICLVCCED